VLAVGKGAALVDLRAFGRQTYEAVSRPIEVDTLFDLASLTKVIATTTMAMILVDEGRLDIQRPVAAFLPKFRGGDKDKVSVWHLLTHSSGVDWWAPLYQEATTKPAYLDRICAMDLKFAPGTKSVYSDLGVMLLGEILERVAGEPLDAFARRRIFAPLGMKDTQWKPPPELLPRIAPTELDAAWRKRVVHGEVHDENAFGLGGVAPHAGLFGTGPDLARFAQMLLNGGVYDQHRIVSRETLDRFTTRAGVPDSSRALGWDTPSPGSSAGTLLSPRSFGHTGFTGTSMWMDPDRNLFVILLTNRVHPTRDNNLIRQARPAVADAVVRALGE
jgi:CubicO group peptidase (beta-lactamase class C family)